MSYRRQLVNARLELVVHHRISERRSSRIYLLVRSAYIEVERYKARLAPRFRFRPPGGRPSTKPVLALYTDRRTLRDSFSLSTR
jgi:hypothetical protein